MSHIFLPPYLGEGCGARGHEDLPHAVVKSLHRLIIHAQEALSCALLGDLQEHMAISSLLGALSPVSSCHQIFMKHRREEAEQHLHSLRALAQSQQGFPIPPRKKSLSRPLKLSPHLILQVPDTILVGEFFIAGAALGQDAALKATHVKQQIGVILAVNGHEAILPLHRGDRSRQTVLDIPEYSTTTVKQDVYSDRLAVTEVKQKLSKLSLLS